MPYSYTRAELSTIDKLTFKIRDIKNAIIDYIKLY